MRKYLRNTEHELSIISVPRVVPWCRETVFGPRADGLQEYVRM